MALTGKRLEFPSPPRRKAPLGAWPAFEKRLAETLDALEEDQYLVVSAKRGWAYVQFVGQGSYGLRAECVGNNYLDEAHALRAGQMALLRKIGWLSPTGTREEILASRKTDGSPNFFRDFSRPVACADAARMAVRALTEVFEIPHPGCLEYKAFDKKQRTILVPTLGLKREEPAPPPEKPREETVEQGTSPACSSRVIQIPLEWRSRCGTVLNVSADDPPAAFLIGWDDGRREWIRLEEFLSQRIWLIRDEGAAN